MLPVVVLQRTNIKNKSLPGLIEKALFRKLEKNQATPFNFFTALMIFGITSNASPTMP
jgi:hypothetical protein